MHIRGWHRSGFSNLSRPTPTKKILSCPDPRRMTPIPSHSRVVFFFFFGRNMSVTVKMQYRSQCAHLSWIKIQNVVFCYYIELKGSLNNAQCNNATMLTHTFSIWLFFHLKVDISLSIDIFFIDGVSKLLSRVHRDRRQKRILFALITLQKRNVSLLFWVHTNKRSLYRFERYIRLLLSVC